MNLFLPLDGDVGSKVTMSKSVHLVIAIGWKVLCYFSRDCCDGAISRTGTYRCIAC